MVVIYCFYCESPAAILDVAHLFLDVEQTLWDGEVGVLMTMMMAVIMIVMMMKMVVMMVVGVAVGVVELVQLYRLPAMRLLGWGDEEKDLEWSIFFLSVY